MYSQKAIECHDSQKGLLFNKKIPRNLKLLATYLLIYVGCGIFLMFPEIGCYLWIKMAQTMSEWADNNIIYVAGKITFCKPIKIIQSISREFLSVIFSQRYSIQKLWTCEPFNSRLVWTRRSSKYIHEKSDTMVKLDTKCSKKLLKCTWIFCGKFEQLCRIFGWNIYFMN